MDEHVKLMIASDLRELLHALPVAFALAFIAVGVVSLWRKS
jgi:hypothetical protein